MKKLSILLAIMLLAGCSGMMSRGTSESSGMSGTSGTEGAYYSGSQYSGSQ